MLPVQLRPALPFRAAAGAEIIASPAAQKAAGAPAGRSRLPAPDDRRRSCAVRARLCRRAPSPSSAAPRRSVVPPVPRRPVSSCWRRAPCPAPTPEPWV